MTKDLGGTATTVEVTTAVCEEIDRRCKVVSTKA